MSLATRCTQCGTIFKVVQDQLKVSEGWVRCGRCQEVFNALEGLFDLEREAPPARQTPARPTEADTAPAAAAPPFPAPAPAHAPTPPTAPTAQDLLASETPHPGITHFDLDLPPGESPAAQATPAGTLAGSPATAHAADQLASKDIDLSGLSALDTLSDFSGQAQAPAPAYPETSETDALDSRYLLPNEEAPLKRRRKHRGPEFADAQFPHDLEAEGDWDDAWTSGPGEFDDAPSAHATGSDTAPQVAAADTADTASTASPHEAPQRLEPSLGEAGAPTMASQTGATSEPALGPPPKARAADTGPSTLPSRFGDDFQPESPVLPPSQRQGKPGTRGRAPQPEAPGFVKQAERRAIWRHPAVRGLLSVLALGLTALLAGQAAHHWRHELAAHQPATAPWLAQWCDLAGCQIQAPQQIDDLQVDSIQLVRTPSEGEDTYRLTAIIHNRADIALSWPQLDLNLTDANGQLLVRRVFEVRDARLVPSKDTPEAQGSAPNRKAPALGPVPTSVPANTQTTVQWQLRAPDLKLAGYTAELFYP